MIYRAQRGSLAESMSTCVNVETLDDLAAHLGIDKTVMTVSQYCYDDRTEWRTFVVKVNGQAVGFTNGPL